MQVLKESACYEVLLPGAACTCGGCLRCCLQAFVRVATGSTGTFQGRSEKPAQCHEAMIAGSAVIYMQANVENVAICPAGASKDSHMKHM